MTAFSTIAGILPIAIGFGAGAESRRPMGIAVVGGLLTSTFLTLIVIPIVYVVFSEVAHRVARSRLSPSQRRPSPSSSRNEPRRRTDSASVPFDLAARFSMGMDPLFNVATVPLTF
jgi:hypothetical protein